MIYIILKKSLNTVLEHFLQNENSYVQSGKIYKGMVVFIKHTNHK